MSEPELEEGEKKFSSCKFRSTAQEEIGEFSCCSDNRHMGYICFRRNIEDVAPSHCETCKFYKEKK